MALGMPAAAATVPMPRQTYVAGDFLSLGRIAVSEPASWALLLVGFGIIAMASRRRAFRQVAA
jgi:hypothetical protein